MLGNFPKSLIGTRNRLYENSMLLSRPPFIYLWVGITPTIPIMWQHVWPETVQSHLITDSNPSGSLTNLDLELVGGLIHLDALNSCFDIRECSIVSKGDILSTTFWERKGSTSSASASSYLLRLFGIHQRVHRYMPRFDYISGASNHVADALSRDFHLPWSDLLTSLSRYIPQPVGVTFGRRHRKSFPP